MIYIYIIISHVNFQAPSFLGEKKIAHQEVALPCWNDFCQLTSEGCGTQPLLKPSTFPYEGCFGTCCHVSTTACLKARGSFTWECFLLPWEESSKVIEQFITSIWVWVQFNWITWPSYIDQNNMVSPPALNTCIGGTWGVMGSETSLPLHSFITGCWQTRTQCDQIVQIDPCLTNFWPNWPMFDQLLTNFSPTSPTFNQLFANFTKFTNFANFSPAFHQIR